MYRIKAYTIILLWLPILIKGNGLDTTMVSSTSNQSILRSMAIATGIAATSFLFDNPINNHFKDHSSSLKSVTKVTDLAGDKYLVIPAVLLTYGFAGYIIQDEKLTNTSLQSIQALATTAISTEIIKQLAGRARPYMDKGPHHYSPFPLRDNDYKSMPSGHAALGFAAFTPFAENYSRWIYLVPVSIAAGRVYQNEHWFSDVIIGGGIGFISGYLFSHHKNIQIIPNGLVVNF